MFLQNVHFTCVQLEELASDTKDRLDSWGWCSCMWSSNSFPVLQCMLHVGHSNVEAAEHLVESLWITCISLSDVGSGIEQNKMQTFIPHFLQGCCFESLQRVHIFVSPLIECSWVCSIFEKVSSSFAMTDSASLTGGPSSISASASALSAIPFPSSFGKTDSASLTGPLELTSFYLLQWMVQHWSLYPLSDYPQDFWLVYFSFYKMVVVIITRI